MTSTSELTTVDKFRRYFIAPSSVLIGLGALGYAVEYSMVLYSDSNIGLAIQVLGLGMIMGLVMTTTAIDEWVGGVGTSHAEMENGEVERYEETHSNSKLVSAVSFFQLIFMLCGMVMLVGGHFI